MKACALGPGRGRGGRAPRSSAAPAREVEAARDQLQRDAERRRARRRTRPSTGSKCCCPRATTRTAMPRSCWRWRPRPRRWTRPNGALRLSTACHEKTAAHPGADGGEQTARYRGGTAAAGRGILIMVGREPGRGQRRSTGQAVSQAQQCWGQDTRRSAGRSDRKTGQSKTGQMQADQQHHHQRGSTPAASCSSVSRGRGRGRLESRSIMSGPPVR